MADEINVGELFPGAQEKPTEQPTTGQEQVNPTPDTNPETTQPDPSNTENNTIRTMREELANRSKESNTLKSQIEAISKHLGMTPEEFISQKEKESQEEAAKKLGISPELQAKISAQEKAIREMQEEKVRGRFESNMNALMTSQNLTEKQAGDFLRDANQRGFDVINSNISHTDLYFALNRESILATEREKMRQEILTDIQANGSSAPSPALAGQSPNENKGTLEDFINDYSKSQK